MNWRNLDFREGCLKEPVVSISVSCEKLKKLTYGVTFNFVSNIQVQTELNIFQAT